MRSLGRSRRCGSRWRASRPAAATGAISGLARRAAPGSTGGGSGTGGGGGTPTLTVACQTPALGSPILRLLTRGELVNTLNDIFPSVAGKWTSTLPAATVSSFGFDNDASSAVGSQLAQLLLDTATSLATAVTGSALVGHPAVLDRARRITPAPRRS